MKQNTIKTTCAYCGVGCGIEATIEDALNHIVTISGDEEHPSNFGRLCSKGSTLGDTVSLEGRLLYPEINGKRSDWESALDYVAEGFVRTIEQHGPDSVAFYVSGQLLTEDYYVANKLMKGFIGSPNIDTNSRLCMSSAVVAYKRAFGGDTVPCNYEDLEQAQLITLAGSNAAWCHPILFQRIRTAKEKNPDLKIVVIDPRHTSTCDIADLHLPIKPGADAVLFNGLLANLADCHNLDQTFLEKNTNGFHEALASARKSAADIATVAEACSLSEGNVRQFYDWFNQHEKAVTVYSQGINQSSSGTDKCNSIINCHLASGRIGKPGMGPFSFTGQPNAMGGREVGGLANVLAAHMDLDNPEHIDCVERFWGSNHVADRQGLKAVELFDAIYDGKVKAVWIMGTNPVVSLPNADKITDALKRCEMVVVSDCISKTDTTDYAHVKLPATGWSEKDGTVTNIERRISRQRAIFEASGEAKEDWWIICQIAARMGFSEQFQFQSSADIFREHAALSGFENNDEQILRDFNLSAFSDITLEEYDNLSPIQWPITEKQPQGTARMFMDQLFFTADRKANLIVVNPSPPVNAADAQYPLTLNTGRLRDQWHTMTRTALAPKLNQHRPEPFVEIHPEDAIRYQLNHRGLARLDSRWGSMLARVDVTESQQIGSLFVPMHWTAQLSSRGRVGAVVNPVVDPLSGQPESKQTPVRIESYEPNWYAMVLSRTSLELGQYEYRVTVKGDQYYRYEIAAESEPQEWRQLGHQLLADSSMAKNEWIEYLDESAGFYRGASIMDKKLQGCVFISPSWELPEPGWMSTLFMSDELSRQERLSLLTGLPPKGQEDVGQIICACFSVGEKTILKAIKDNSLENVEQIGSCLSAGMGCGSCIPELKELLFRKAS